jgi:hypothetical protein
MVALTPANGEFVKEASNGLRSRMSETSFASSMCCISTPLIVLILT